MGVRKIMIKRVAVVKFRMDNGCGNGTDCYFLIEVRTDTMKCTNKRIADKSIEIRTDE